MTITLRVAHKNINLNKLDFATMVGIALYVDDVKIVPRNTQLPEIIHTIIQTKFTSLLAPSLSKDVKDIESITTLTVHYLYRCNNSVFQCNR